jgi:hypothetical protein
MTTKPHITARFRAIVARAIERADLEEAAHLAETPRHAGEVDCAA